jgi:hypothetical protein
MSGTVTRNRLNLRVELDLARYLGALHDFLLTLQFAYNPNSDTMVCDSCSQPVKDGHGNSLHFSKEKFNRFTLDFIQGTPK